MDLLPLPYIELVKLHFAFIKDAIAPYNPFIFKHKPEVAAFASRSSHSESALMTYVKEELGFVGHDGVNQLTATFLLCSCCSSLSGDSAKDKS